jgi:hypothetical protein
VFAGFEFTNSEVDNGRFTITPRLTVRICGNGLTITADALSKVHVGARLDEGVIKWSRDTEARARELVTAQSRDAVEHFLNPQYIQEKVADIEAKASRPVTDAPKTVELVSKALSFTPAQQTTILDHFIKGGQLTAGGILQAVTSAANHRRRRHGARHGGRRSARAGTRRHRPMSQPTGPRRSAPVPRRPAGDTGPPAAR